MARLFRRHGNIVPLVGCESCRAFQQKYRVNTKHNSGNASHRHELKQQALYYGNLPLNLKDM